MAKQTTKSAKRSTGVNVDKLAATVLAAQRDAKAIAQLSTRHKFRAPTGYRINDRVIEMRLDQGEHIVGVKMGLTSRAKMIQMGVSDMIWGWLTDAMLIEDGGTVSFKDFIHPRVEPEVAFLMGASLEGPVSPMQAMAAVEAVAPALEIVDSRYRNFKFTLEDVVADNSSAAGFVVGPWCPPEFDISNLGMVMEFDGRPAQIGSSAAILGHPARSLAAASRMVAERGHRLEPGMIVLAGGATAADALRPGVSVRNTVEELGAAAFRVAP